MLTHSDSPSAGSSAPRRLRALARRFRLERSLAGWGGPSGVGVSWRGQIPAGGAEASEGEPGERTERPSPVVHVPEPEGA
jgi:hypothetical protein